MKTPDTADAGACAPRTEQSAPRTGEIAPRTGESFRHSMLRRCLNWDYTQPCIYQITIVLAERGSKALGEVIVDQYGKDGRPLTAHCELSALGKAILAHWQKIGAFTPEIKPLFCQIMPDHLHGILHVTSPMKRPLGNAVGGFKTGCEKIFQSFSRGLAPSPQDRPPTCSVEAAQAARSAQAAEAPRLFAPGFQDTILFHEGQLNAMFNYLRTNPLRLAVKRANPALFTVADNLAIALGAAGVGHFSALGNRFLLDRPLVQVQVSRQFFGYKRIPKPGGGTKIAKDVNGEPAVAFSTPEYQKRRDELFAAVRHGAVLLSPCVSDGERQIAREALVANHPLIAMSNKGFSKLQKPSGRHFEACAAGRLLLLAPAAWPFQPGEKAMTRFDATAMNRLCQWIACDGAAEINYHGMEPVNIDALAREAAKCEEVR